MSALRHPHVSLIVPPLLVVYVLLGVHLIEASTYHVGVLSGSDSNERDPALSLAIEDFMDIHPDINITYVLFEPFYR